MPESELLKGNPQMRTEAELADEDKKVGAILRHWQSGGSSMGKKKGDGKLPAPEPEEKESSDTDKHRAPLTS